MLKLPLLMKSSSSSIFPMGREKLKEDCKPYRESVKFLRHDQHPAILGNNKYMLFIASIGQKTILIEKCKF